MAHVPELPGCFVTAASQAEALQALPAEIADYLSWLKEIHETAPPAAEPIQLDVTETFTIPRKVAEGDTEAAFSHDLKPLSDQELEWHLRLLTDSRQRLIAMLQHLEQESAQESEETFYKMLRWRPDEDSRSILEHIYHIFTAEAWYLARLSKEPATGWAHYQVLRQLTIDRLRRLTPEERRQITLHPKDTDQERWTARKVIRRALWHERYHLRHIADTVRKYKTQGDLGL